jgi:inhibitor of cysteine peptidase
MGIFMLNLTTADAGTKRSAAVGDEVTVSLAENPTTGYRWQPAIDKAMLAPVDDTFEPASDATGAGGTRRLTFKVLHDGATELRLRKVRSWQPDDAAEEFVVTLDVT